MKASEAADAWHNVVVTDKPRMWRWTWQAMWAWCLYTHESGNWFWAHMAASTLTRQPSDWNMTSQVACLQEKNVPRTPESRAFSNSISHYKLINWHLIFYFSPMSLFPVNLVLREGTTTWLWSSQDSGPLRLKTRLGDGHSLRYWLPPGALSGDSLLALPRTDSPLQTPRKSLQVTLVERSYFPLLLWIFLGYFFIPGLKHAILTLIHPFWILLGISKLIFFTPLAERRT